MEKEEIKKDKTRIQLEQEKEFKKKLEYMARFRGGTLIG